MIKILKSSIIRIKSNSSALNSFALNELSDSEASRFLRLIVRKIIVTKFIQGQVTS